MEETFRVTYRGYYKSTDGTIQQCTIDEIMPKSVFARLSADTQLTAQYIKSKLFDCVELQDSVPILKIVY